MPPPEVAENGSGFKENTPNTPVQCFCIAKGMKKERDGSRRRSLSLACSPDFFEGCLRISGDEKKIAPGDLDTIRCCRSGSPEIRSGAKLLSWRRTTSFYFEGLVGSGNQPSLFRESFERFLVISGFAACFLCDSGEPESAIRMRFQRSSRVDRV